MLHCHTAGAFYCNSAVEYLPKPIKKHQRPCVTNDPDLPYASIPVKLSDRGRELALAHFNHVEQQVSLAATTAGLIVAADALLLGGYIAVTKDYEVFNTFGPTAPGVLYAMAGGLIVLGFLFALFAVFPNIKFASLQFTVENVLFFGWVGKQKFDKYLKTFVEKDSQNGQELDRELLRQVWGKSRWLNKMFSFIQLAVLCTILGTLLTCGVLIAYGRLLHIPN